MTFHLGARLRGSLAILCLAAAILATPCKSLSQSEAADIVEQLRQNTVRIEAAQHGFGFVVGEKDRLLYIVTARHILVGEEDNPDSQQITTARITFFSDQGKSYTADVLGTHTGDVAVLRVSAPPNFHWVAECLAGADKVDRTTPVWFVGRRDEWYIPALPGAIASRQPSAESLIDIDNLPVSRGTSGAPLISNTGIVGMIQQDLAGDTRAVTIDFIKRAFQGWNYPWDLRPASIFPACLKGTWKEQYDNPASWSFVVDGNSLRIERMDNLFPAYSRRSVIAIMVNCTGEMVTYGKT